MFVSQKEIDLLAREKYSGHKTSAFEVDLKRLETGEPLDYVIGWREFLGLKIDLSFRPLIPREETEFWTKEVLSVINQRTAELGRPLVVLDLFAGSGCIGLAVLKYCPRTKVVLADVDPNSLTQIRKNLRINNLTKLAKVSSSNIFSGLANQQFDFILANPPYISKRGRGSLLQTTVKNYEPAKALWAGSDGLKIIKPFLKQARKYLKPNGEIYLEFGFGQKTALRKLLRTNNYSNFSFKLDQFKRWRWLVIKT
ncbi:MAG: hypothetical protein COX02_00685 [Candidatus Vogelbacteria bacterium CG22_combo_CG10-13_8_21_14_all_37_9]|uniref:peptide chain release factor N(5)-glutamine methyltransferase n=1 Tax=Candidatus Vogelbacteria bacterium CG22_combo_CG10-13_8_21_14_all_37_9 TaxID=1975046 RepID=A0A2H0BMY0_9BACT|nr:MAG: hypothetical protein COX02_00685 [Candidatus Vogelbacteria bacterium CG22_combo_CG10-13_8_21_14_all_37_9]